MADRAAAQNPDGIVVLMVILPTADLPDGPTRAENSTRMRKLAPAMRRFVTVAIGNDFRISMVRTVMRALSVLQGKTKVHFVTETAEAGVSRLLEAAGRTPRGPFKSGKMFKPCIRRSPGWAVSSISRRRVEASSYSSARMGSVEKRRCGWSGTDPLYVAYHDTEWGVPVHDDRVLYEFLVLEGAQAGLSWITVLRKREAYRAAFDRFRPEKVARYDREKVASLLQNPGIVRNRMKVESAIKNARAFLKVQEEFGSFDAYQWRFVDGRPLVSRFRSLKEVPARTEVSDALSRDLKQRGFSFVGSTIIYAHMQAVGMVNDHIVDCFRYRKLAGRAAKAPGVASRTRARSGRL